MLTASKASKGPTSMKVEVYFLTRDYRVLFGLVALILAVGILLAMNVSGTRLDLDQANWQEVNPGRITQPMERLEKALVAQDDLPDDVKAKEVAILLLALEAEAGAKKAAEQWEKIAHVISTAAITPARKQLYLEFAGSMASITRLPTATLTTLAYRQQLPAANFLMAFLYLRQEDEERVRQFLHREALFPQSSMTRMLELELAMKARDVVALEKMASDPHYLAEWTPAAAMMLAMEKHDWLEVFLRLFELQWKEVQAGIVLLVLISGGIWFTIWLQAIQLRESPTGRLVLCSLAFLLGVLSTTPTLLLVVSSERFLGLVEGAGFWRDVAYYMLGVGPREEFCKWLAVLPLVPALLRRGSKLEMLVVPGFVGLGFAVAENFNYFSEFATAAYARFLTANFFHVAATALIGLSFMEAWMNPRRWWGFPLTFLIVSALHGVYDVFIAITVLQPLQVISSMAFVALALMFFRKLRLFRSLETNYFWMPASIVLGLAVVMAATMVEASARTGFTPAMVVLGYHSITFCMIVYLFIWQTRSLRYDADL